MDGLISDYQARGTLALKRGSGLSQLLRPLWRSVTSEPTSLARPHTIFGRPRWSLRPGSLQGGAVGSSGPPGSPPARQGPTAWRWWDGEPAGLGGSDPRNLGVGRSACLSSWGVCPGLRAVAQEAPLAGLWRRPGRTEVQSGHCPSLWGQGWGLRGQEFPGNQGSPG